MVDKEINQWYIWREIKKDSPNRKAGKSFTNPQLTKGDVMNNTSTNTATVIPFPFPRKRPEPLFAEGDLINLNDALTIGLDDPQLRSLDITFRNLHVLDGKKVIWEIRRVG